jgi:hypothetical protein
VSSALAISHGSTGRYRRRARDGVDGQRNDIAERERERRAGRDHVHGERRERDDGGGRRTQQGHREGGGDERRADGPAAGAQREELPCHRKPEQGQHQSCGLPVVRAGSEHGGCDRGCEQHGLTGGEDAVPPANPRSGGDFFSSLRAQRH